ncbi:hypothetical protein C8P68_11176 [Mucilaginibacter yixingensis]|uniref:Uncharacterized protein n=1 Tax=Mucilaginibacter yixingensis TaxID=1295612 RepID=A0A2T5J4W4_9SPHI|nr:hypothetical protein C8P68_11176 [Mucilaginibacter yixingensis]
MKAAGATAELHMVPGEQHGIANPEDRAQVDSWILNFIKMYVK